MEYQIEELMGIVGELSRKYTSGESSSVTYETANMLMGAVMYCIEEYNGSHTTGLINPEESVKVQEVYKQGYELVIQKVYRTKDLYEKILRRFKDYGCQNCRDTVIKGIPAFFLKYDAKFSPQDHILTLDYPTLVTIQPLCGVDAIYQYLLNIEKEWDFLNAFSSASIIQLLQRTIPDYKTGYYDNIAYHVMLHAIGCFLADKSVEGLMLEVQDMEMIAAFFEGMDVDEREDKIVRLMEKLIPLKGRRKTEVVKYFGMAGRDFAVRIANLRLF